MEGNFCRPEALLERMPAIVTCISGDGRFLYVNAQFERLFEVSSSEVEGLLVTDAAAQIGVSREVADLITSTVADVVAFKATRRISFPIAAPDRRVLHLENTSVPALAPDGSVSAVIGLTTDTTEKVKAREELERTSEQLRVAQRMEVVGQLAGGVAHEFNNIFTAMNGYVFLLSRSDEATTRRYAEQLKASVDRAASLTHQLQLFGRQLPHDPVQLNVNSCIDLMLKPLGRLLGDNVELLFELDDALPEIHADEVRIDQIVMNLVLNARDALSAAGTIRVGTAVHAPEGGNRDRYVVISIQDNGAGMSDEIRERVFDPFFTTKHDQRATGLGLSVVYGIVEEYDGWIEVGSVPGEGTEVRVFLPVASDTRHAEREPFDEANIDD